MEFVAAIVVPLFVFLLPILLLLSYVAPCRFGADEIWALQGPCILLLPLSTPLWWIFLRRIKTDDSLEAPVSRYRRRNREFQHICEIARRRVIAVRQHRHRAAGSRPSAKEATRQQNPDTAVGKTGVEKSLRRKWSRWSGVRRNAESEGRSLSHAAVFGTAVSRVECLFQRGLISGRLVRATLESR